MAFFACGALLAWYASHVETNGMKPEIEMSDEYFWRIRGSNGPMYLLATIKEVEQCRDFGLRIEEMDNSCFLRSTLALQEWLEQETADVSAIDADATDPESRQEHIERLEMRFAYLKLAHANALEEMRLLKLAHANALEEMRLADEATA